MRGFSRVGEGGRLVARGGALIGAALLLAACSTPEGEPEAQDAAGETTVEYVTDHDEYCAFPVERLAATDGFPAVDESIRQLEGVEDSEATYTVGALVDEGRVWAYLGAVNAAYVQVGSLGYNSNSHPTHDGSVFITGVPQEDCEDTRDGQHVANAFFSRPVGN
jgi:hypothetical protein